MRLRFRSLAMALLAVVSLSAMPTPRFAGGVKTVVAEPALLSDIALIMGGTGQPDPPPWFVNAVNHLYVQPHFPGYIPVPLHTPEESFPTFGLLTGEQSVAQGVADLNAAITHMFAGDNVLSFGVSQSALIASLEEQNLANNPPGGLGELHFALLGDPASPAGGIFERFAGLDNPVINLNIYPPTPTDLFPTDIYTGEYDGVSDFPEDPSNILAVANAIDGIFTVHLKYGNLTAEQVQSAVLLGHSGLTNFYMIPTQTLPILQSLYDGSASDKVLADFLQPQLQVIVNMGYGNLEHGILPDPGGVDGAVPIGFFPKLDPLAVQAAMDLGRVEGTVNATNDLLASQGSPLLPEFVTTLLKSASGYDFTSWLDKEFIAGLTFLSTLTGNADLNPSVLFDGLPLISGSSVIDAINQWATDPFMPAAAAL